MTERTLPHPTVRHVVSWEHPDLGRLTACGQPPRQLHDDRHRRLVVGAKNALVRVGPAAVDQDGLDRGGQRDGAGRPKRGPRKKSEPMPHTKRTEFKKLPVHITLRVLRAVGNLRPPIPVYMTPPPMSCCPG